MSSVLFSAAGGSVVLPHQVLCDRRDGAHLIVNPPRPVWERSVLAPAELAAWALLVAATGRAMLEVLPVLADGCLNYWEADNWALNDEAEPRGPKDVRSHRRVHLHLLGRSRQARDPDWRWGESPRFPAFADVAAWSARFAPINEGECAAVRERALALLADHYRLPGAAEPRR